MTKTNLTTLPSKDINELYNALTVALIEMVEGSAVVGFNSESGIYSMERKFEGDKSVVLQLMTNPVGNNYSLRVLGMKDDEVAHHHWVDEGSGILAHSANGFVHLSKEVLRDTRQALLTLPNKTGVGI